MVLVLLLSTAALAQSLPAGVASQAVKLPAQKAQVFQPPKSPASPVLTLTPDRQSARPSESIHFKATWNTNVYRMAYHFDWGDDQSTDGKSLEADHAYASPGAYTVRVIATSESPTLAKQMPGIYSNEVSITVTQPPSAAKKRKPKQPLLPALTLGPPDIQAPAPNQTVHFTASWDRKPYVEKYTFDWGDGQTSQAGAPEASHSYAVPRTYTVHAIANITWNDETIAITSNDVAVEVAAPLPQRVARLEPDRRNARVGEPVTFTATVTPPSPVVRYHFAFGDGAEQDSSSNQIVHTYEQARNVQAAVTATIDGTDAPATSGLLELTIGPRVVKPRLGIILHGNFIAGEDMTLQASLEPFHEDARFQFDWGDGTPREKVGVQGGATHRYARKGTYNATVTAWIGRAESSQVEKSVILIIQAPPIPWLIILAGLGAAGTAAYLIKRGLGHRPPGPGFRVAAFPGTSDHNIARMDRSVARLSLTLNPGMDAARHNLIFPKRVAASD
jgi:PKD repeat protein